MMHFIISFRKLNLSPVSENKTVFQYYSRQDCKDRLDLLGKFIDR